MQPAVRNRPNLRFGECNPRYNNAVTELRFGGLHPPYKRGSVRPCSQSRHGQPPLPRGRGARRGGKYTGPARQPVGWATRAAIAHRQTSAAKKNQRAPALAGGGQDCAVVHPAISCLPAEMLVRRIRLDAAASRRCGIRASKKFQPALKPSRTAPISSSNANSMGAWAPAGPESHAQANPK